MEVVAKQRQDKQQQPPPSASQMGGGFDECTLWVGHIPAADASVDVLARVFSRHGEVKSVEVREKADKSWAYATSSSAVTPSTRSHAAPAQNEADGSVERFS